MHNLDYYEKASLDTLIPVNVKMKDNSINDLMIPKNELWFEADVFSGHKNSGFKFDKLQKALDKRGINYKSANYPFI